MMNFDERELKKILNKDDTEHIFIDDYNVIITTDEREIIISSETKIKIEIKDREFIE